VKRTTIYVGLAVSLISSVSGSAHAQGFSPSEAAGKMTVANGLDVRLFAAEPLIRQPVAIEFDDRGRLWVIQYLQYPNPAGLSRVKVDRFSRTIYDRMPDPPPRGPTGADRVTILEDTDGDGKADHSHDFVSGLNLASGLAFGYGGVYILQPPYLLFYADRNHDDRPDGEPEVLLSGFGIEDAHSVANSLTWGPDGWLYGLQGSTVTARIRGIEFQQGIWRFHPTTRRFELFCEGGGNMWGLDFDRFGNLFASTNVGGFVMLHGVQGGYYWKSFGKHGPLHNSYTFGYFEHVAHSGLSGGHVSVGGLFYEADAFPKEWRGRYIAADLLDHSIHWHEVSPRGSTFQARQGGDVLRANDTWFAPSDMTLGPDGALYVTDWHDKRTAHPDPDADWDRSNGRIYVVSVPGAKVGQRQNLSTQTNRELIALLRHPNTWYRRRARRILSERRASDFDADLRQAVRDERGVGSLEAYWAHYGCVGFDETLAEELLTHPDRDVRTWAVRLSGDEPHLSDKLSARLVALAETEPDACVRSQLACSAQRLPRRFGLDIARKLLLRDPDGSDPHLPLLLWWAVERHALDDPEMTLAKFASPESWQSALMRSAIVGRLMRRFASEGTATGDEVCVRLMASARTQADRRVLISALEEGTRGRRPSLSAQSLITRITTLASEDVSNFVLIQLAARMGSRSAIDRVRAVASDESAPDVDRRRALELLGEIKDGSAVRALIDAATLDPSLSIRTTALSVLGRFEDATIADALIAAYPKQGAAWQSRAREILLNRQTMAKFFLTAIDRGEFPAKEVPMEQLANLASFRDANLDALVLKHWGSHRGSTPEERLAEVRRLNNDLRAAAGDRQRGRLVFQKHCASCHRLFGEGETVGPDLTFANRQDRDYLLISLVDPSGVVRKEYQAFNIHTTDGRVLAGLIVEQSPATVTLRDGKGDRTRIARSEIEVIKESATSLMPDSLYKELNPDELRDLFRYLQDEGTEFERKPQ
jgi:putative membrane-bound dehydrogenase-like protein